MRWTKRGMTGKALIVDLRRTRSGSFLLPVSRFHSSNVWFEILPSTSNWANLRR